MKLLYDGKEDFLGLNYLEIDYLLYLLCGGSEEEKRNKYEQIMGYYRFMNYMRTRKYPSEYEDSYYVRQARAEQFRANSQQSGKKMTPEEFKNKMQEISESEDGFGDLEIKHIDADKLMCDLLRELGYSEGVDLFEDMDKWYA